MLSVSMEDVRFKKVQEVNMLFAHGIEDLFNLTDDNMRIALGVKKLFNLRKGYLEEIDLATCPCEVEVCFRCFSKHRTDEECHDCDSDPHSEA